MNIFTIRRARLKHVVDTTAAGNVSSFAERVGYSRAQISQFLSETYNGGRSIGERAARTIEERVNCPSGWLDQPMNSLGSLVEPFSIDHTQPNSRLNASLQSEVGRLRVNVLATVTPDEEGVCETLELSGMRAGTRTLKFHSTANDVYAIQIKGGALRPRVKSGEYLVVEGDLKPVPGDDVVVKFADGSWIILQLLYVRGDELVFGSINEGRPTATVPEYDVVSMGTITAIISNREEIETKE